MFWKQIPAAFPIVFLSIYQSDFPVYKSFFGGFSKLSFLRHTRSLWEFLRMPYEMLEFLSNIFKVSDRHSMEGVQLRQFLPTVFG